MLEMERSARLFRLDRRDPDRLSRVSAIAVTVGLSLLLWLATILALGAFFD